MVSAKDDQQQLRDDCIDIRIQDIQDQHSRDLLSDPTLNDRSLRRDRKRNYKEMLEGNEAFQKSMIDEQIEIRQRFSVSDGQNEAYEQYKTERANSRKKLDADKVFSDENDMIMDAHENGDLESSDEDLEDRLDAMDAEELDMIRNQEVRKAGPVSKKNANDRSGDTCADHLQEREDEADDTVFIDNLPKGEGELRQMIQEVDFHIRDLEKKFFEEEDSEAEQEMKTNLLKSNYSAAEHNEQLERLKEKSYIQQFWTIPLSENVIGFNWQALADAQQKHGGQLFDIITCDPPW